MKKVFCTILGLAFCFAIHAQDKEEEVKEKVKNKTENRIDNKIDNAIDGGLNKLEGLFKKKGKKNKKGKSDSDSTNTKKKTGSIDMSGLFGGGTKLEIKPNYEFASDITYDFETDEKGDGAKIEKMTMQYFYSKVATDNYLGLKLDGEEIESAQNVMTVMDNGQMLTFMTQEGMKIVSGIVISAPEDAIDGSEDDFFDEETDKVPEFKKTGKTKTILGYSCDEYVTETDEYKMNFWVAPTLTQQTNGMFSMYSTMNKKSNLNQKFLESTQLGMMMEMESLDKKTNDKFIMKAKEINLNKATTFSTTGYQQLNFSNFMDKNKN